METGREFLLESEIKQDTNSHFLFHKVMEALAVVIRQENTIQWVAIRREEAKLFLFSYAMILYLKHPIKSTKKLMNILSSIANFQDTESVF